MIRFIHIWSVVSIGKCGNLLSHSSNLSLNYLSKPYIIAIIQILVWDLEIIVSTLLYFKVLTPKKNQLAFKYYWYINYSVYFWIIWIIICIWYANMEMCYVVKVNFSIQCLPVTQLLCPGVFIVTNFLCILPEVSVHSQTYLYTFLIHVQGHCTHLPFTYFLTIFCFGYCSK